MRSGPGQLRRRLHQRFGQAPGTYSVEAYDAAAILLKGIDSGAVTRPALRDFVAGYDGPGPRAPLQMDRHWGTDVRT